MGERVTIARLGAAGDGIAETAGGPVYVPDALPGETIDIEREGGQRGRILARGATAPERVEPFCPYYERCGGCVAQHVRADLYRTWKRDLVVQALVRAGLDLTVAPLVDAGGEGRRRIVLHAREVDGRIAVGFMERRSHHLIDIQSCPITVPALHTAPPVATRLARHLSGLRKPLDLAMTATAGGLDVDIRGSGPLAEGRRQALIREASGCRLARLSLHGEVLVEAERPVVQMGRGAVVLPPGGFLQATAAGEAALAAIVVEACRGAKRVADLFAGSGPFALRLAEGADVHAVEADQSALASLDRAARAASALRRVTTEARDLFRRPLLAPELARFDAVVLDPPRAGAEAQVRQLILSSCRAVIMLSCDPGTFARDAALLLEAGFEADPVVPIDQFKWSPHLEIAGVFRRAPVRPRRR